MNKKEITSEFGKGFIYNLILFACHFERTIIELKGKEDYGIWFNGASDHLYELEIPEQWKNTKIGKKAKELQDLALDIGHGNRMMEAGEKIEEDYSKVVELTKEIGFLIDKKLGIKPIKAQWE